MGDFMSVICERKKSSLFLNNIGLNIFSKLSISFKFGFEMLKLLLSTLFLIFVESFLFYLKLSQCQDNNIIRSNIMHDILFMSFFLRVVGND